MPANNHHSNQMPVCDKCQEMLKTAHPLLASWFNTLVKPKHRDCHIGQSWRNEKDQNMDYALGKSKVKWPMSMHNRMDKDGSPCSMALDLFQLASNDLACWPWSYFKTIANETRDTHHAISWGGDWKQAAASLGDGDHFQLDTP